jgi:hypothetical protein
MVLVKRIDDQHVIKIRGTTHTHTHAVVHHNLSQVSTEIDVVISYPRKVVHDKFPTYTCSAYFSETLGLLAGYIIFPRF